jgi:hypothetical protein
MYAIKCQLYVIMPVELILDKCNPFGYTYKNRHKFA